MARVKIATNFFLDEFECKCGCGKKDINQDFVNKLQLVRTVVDRGFTIKSGCRCETHNKKEGGKPNSSHVRGLGADIACYDSVMRFKIIKAAIELGFTRIGIARTFIHLDIDSQVNGLPTEVCWLY